MSRTRIRQLAVLVVCLMVALAAALYQLTIEQHELWLERSYQNRWVFRDVPTRRGSILDVAGRRIAGFQGAGSAGINSVTWDGRDEAGRQVASGQYFYRLEAGSYPL